MRNSGGDPSKHTGANKTDVALHWLYRSCLTNDGPLLAKTVAFAYEPLALVSGEGIQYDYSFFQHGHQLYTTGYGPVFINGVTQFAVYTAGTPYALSGEKLDILSKFVRETYFPSIRGQYALFSLGGRGGLSRQGSTRKTNSAVYAERMRLIDTGNTSAYDNAILRLRGEQPACYGITANHVHYPIGDYTIHTRSGYVFDVRMVSKRTVRIEMGNEENLKTYYASDGSTNIVRRGDEYNAIFGVWDWTKVPGITCAQVSSIPRPKSYITYGTAIFAGGVSDSLYGVTAYSYDAGYTGNSAQKAWFFFDDEVVCLGSGITADASVSMYDMHTTINQCLLQGEVQASVQGSSSVLGKGEHTFTSPDWILHDGIGYVFPQSSIVGMSNKSQNGNWHDINVSQPDRAVTRDVFSLWVDHGKNVVNGGYAYIVVPEKNSAGEMEEYHRNNPVEILSNNDSIQAVYHKELDMLGLVFYTAGHFEHKDISVQTDKACIILFKNIKKTNVEMHISDPAQAKSRITILTCFPAISSGVVKTVCDFGNTGVYAGMTKTYSIGI
jgi:chondroitin AC lyase